MNDLTTGKTMTVREVAEVIGASYRTVAAYAQKAGWTKNGKQTLLDENQVAVIVEAMKSKETGAAFHQRENGETLHNVMQGVETTRSRAVRLAVLAQKQHEINLQIQEELKSEIAELKTENRTLANNLKSTQTLLDHRTDGLAMIQRIAEAGGCLLSDREELYSAYRGRV